MLQIQTIVSMPFAENSYVVWRDERQDAIVVDPGLEPDAILEFLLQRELTLSAILNTHGHADHIAGNTAMKEKFPTAPLVIGINDAPMLRDPVANLSSAFGFEILSPPADQTVREGDSISFAGIDFEVLDIPGHSPGHVVFLVREKPIIVLGGDVLFRGSIGRTDFPGGSFETLASGIRTKLYTLPDDTVVYPGHGPVTKTGHEKRSNEYVPG
ncbi:MAG: MBL fold metallo-hydrolase [Planctomycetes bacterium]|nr:MBL fold metallo-hydrolase [Planctomycetota bacterium]